MGLRPLAEAVQFRVFALIPRTVNAGYYEAAARLFVDRYDQFVHPGQPMATWEWIQSMPSRRRKVLVRAWRLYQERGHMHAQAEYIKPFVKTEHMPFFQQDAENCDFGVEGVTYLARLIQAPHDDTHLIAGRYLKPLVKRLKEIWSYENDIFYASASPDKLDAWLNRNAGATSWFWADYSAFDATYSERTWAMVEGFYHMIYPDADQEFFDVLRIWRTVRGKQRLHHREEQGASIAYSAPFVNASGRDDTALANALVNGIVLAIAFACALSGKEPWDLTLADLRDERYQIAVVGDDSLVACHFDVDRYRADIIRVVEGFGLVVKAGTSKEMVDVTFLGQMPYLAGGKFYWGPTLGRRLYKAFWQAEPLGNLPAWTLGVAKQLDLYRHVPILSDIARRVIELLQGCKSTSVTADENRPWTTRTEATPDYDSTTLWWLAHRYREYGLAPEAIAADIQEIQGISRLPAVIRLRTTDVALSVDDL
jgi:hypothetical protein